MVGSGGAGFGTAGRGLVWLGAGDLARRPHWRSDTEKTGSSVNEVTHPLRQPVDA
jgi:hypothetical protein